MTKLTTEPRDIFVRAVDLEALGISISYVMTDDPARLAECKRNAQTIADALSTTAPAFEAKHISLTQKDAKLLLTLELDAVESAPVYLATPINPAAVRSSVFTAGNGSPADQEARDLKTGPYDPQSQTPPSRETIDRLFNKHGGPVDNEGWCLNKSGLEDFLAELFSTQPDERRENWHPADNGTAHYYTAEQLAEFDRAAPAAAPIWCQACGDSITAHDPGICGNCYAMKYRDRPLAAAQPCGICEGDRGADASGYACAVQPDERAACVHADNPKSCYRVRCQLGNKCVDDDMSPRAASPQSGEKCPACAGNDGDMPCAFPEGGQLGCLRDVRLARASAPQAALTEEQRDRLTLIADSLSRSTSAKDRAAAEGLRALLTQAPIERMSDADEPSIRALYEDACIQANKNAEDAERYRWLKMRSSIPDQQRIMLSTPWGQWDAVIDAARKAEIDRNEGDNA